MRVTFCTLDYPAFTGGPNIWLRRLLPALKDYGVDVNVLLLHVSGKLEDCPCYQELLKEGIDVRTFSWWANTPKKIQWLLRQLAVNPPDVFVPNLIIAGYFATFWLKQAGIPVVGVLHSDDDFYREIINQFVFGKLALQLSSLVVVSKFLEESVQSHHPSVKLERIPCGVPLPANIANPPQGTLKLVYAGRLEEEQKRISDVTLALCRVVEEVPGTEAVIYGEGTARSQVEKIIAERGKKLPIKLDGLIDGSQMQQVMREHHVFVLLSDYEGLPIALMEAMACGLVPVCLNIRSGISELVENQVTGLLVSDRGDDFVRAIKQLKEQPNLWQQLAWAARRKIESSYSHEVCALQWLHLLQGLTQQKRQSPSKITVPRLIALPPVRPAFAFCDFRPDPFKKNVIKKFLNRQFGLRTKILKFISANFLWLTK